MTETSWVSIGVAAFIVVAGGIGAANVMIIRLHSSIAKFGQGLQDHVKEYDERAKKDDEEHARLHRRVDHIETVQYAHGERLTSIETSHRENVVLHHPIKGAKA